VLRIKGELLLPDGNRNSTIAGEHHLSELLDWRKQGALSRELRSAVSLARLRQGESCVTEANCLRVICPFPEGFEQPI
jgi:hypothetical protein